MAVIKKNFSYMEFPLSISRQDAFPLDKSGLYFDKSAAETYAKSNPTAYPGQTISVVNEGKRSVDVYKIEIDGTLTPIGGVQTIVQAKNPTTSDWKYEIGQVWINSTDKSVWMLVATSDSNGVWKKLVTNVDIESLGGGDMLASVYAKGEGAGAGTGKVDHALVADKLTTPKAINIKGDATGTANFDGSANADIAVTLKNVGTVGAYVKVTTDAQGRVIKGEKTITHTEVTGLGSAATKNTGNTEGNIPLIGSGNKLDKAIIPTLSVDDISGLGDAAKKNVALGTGVAGDNGKVVVLGPDGKLPEGVLPSLAIGDVTTVASKADLTTQGTKVQKGDITIVTNESKTYILSKNPSSALENWVELKSPASGVASVNGLTGAVTLTTDKINEGSTNHYYTEARGIKTFGDEWSKKTTDNLTQGGTNKYYTDALVKNYLESSTIVFKAGNAAGAFE